MRGMEWRRRIGTQGGCRKGKIQSDVLLVVGLLLGWFILQSFVLPRLGVST